MKARIVLALVAGWMALAASPLPAQSRAVAPTVSAQARAAVAEVGHVRVMVALRPRVALSRARQSPIKALRLVQLEAVADSVLDSLPPGSHALRPRFPRVPAPPLEVAARGPEDIGRAAGRER